MPAGASRRVVIPEVWAPRAARVDLVVEGGPSAPLTARGGGWHAGTDDLPAGTRYWFRVDGSSPLLADPRSHHQPDGIDGPSAVVDHDAFRWTDGDWSGFDPASAVLYELHIGTFSAAGTFDGAIEHLDHLVDLGVTAVEVMPVAEFMGTRGWGYDGVLLYAPHHAYGGPDGFKRFVDACHRRGLAVVLDVVYNHVGPVGNHLEAFGPYFTDAHDTPWGKAVNLDQPGSAEVRAFLVGNARHWRDRYHVDGLRLDAVHALHDDSPTHFFAELSAAVGDELWLVAEREQNELVPLLPRDEGGWGLHARWSDDLHHALHSVLTGERHGYYAGFGSPDDIVTALARVHVRPGDEVPVGTPGSRFVVCAQNHDQVGNRARGERLAHLAGVRAQMAAAAVILTSPYVPLLFQGEEWAASSPFPYFVEPDSGEMAAAIREGRRAEFAAFGWAPDDVLDPVAPETFEMAKLRWDERTAAPHAEVLAWYRRLIELRRTVPELGPGRVGVSRRGR